MPRHHTAALRGMRLCSGLLGAFAAGLAAQPAHAHGFFVRYGLPVPLWLYLVGAGATVAVSFVLVARFARRPEAARDYPRLNLLRWRLGRMLVHPALSIPVKLAAVGVFVLLILAGLFGAQDPFRNIAPTLVWVIWWVGLAYVCVLLGNLWVVLNPWRALFAWAEAAHRRLRPGRELTLGLRYPERLGVWPAVALFLVFAWMELIWHGAEVPAQLAAAILVYSAMTWAGMLLFGRECWLRAGEVFSVVFGLLARFAPTEVRVVDPRVCRVCSSSRCGEPADETSPVVAGPDPATQEPRVHRLPLDPRVKPAGDQKGDAAGHGCTDCLECFARADPAARRLNLRPFAAGLLPRAPVHPSMVAFVVLILSTVTFDGFLETPAWAQIQDWVLSSALLRPLLIELREWTGDLRLVIASAGLFVFPPVFLGAYLLFARLTAAAASAVDNHSTGDLARAFVLSLVPIAIAYHLAHYIWYLLVAGQFVIPLASDPFGYGWDLFGTVRYRIDVGIVGPRFVWYTAVAAVVIGHVVAVYLAHVTALRVFAAKSAALRSQYPMLGLMVGYTMTSLWILAQPVVESRPGG